MSASSKKKIRAEQNAAALTERQKTEQIEAKKLKNMTIIFVIAIALVLAAAVGILISRGVTKSGVVEKNTIAATIGDKKLSTAELNYYYTDAINSLYSPLREEYSTSAPAYALLMYGLDVTKPLDEQDQNSEEGITWADYFVNQAITNAKGVYALCSEAQKNGHTLTEEEQASVDTIRSNLDLYAGLYGFGSADAYLNAIYGYGSDLDSYMEYYSMSALASSYQAAHSQTLTYEDADLRAFEADKSHYYDAFNYAVYTVYSSNYLEGGTKDDEGNTTYTDEEKAASVTKAEAAANALIEGVTNIEELNAAIAAMPQNADAEKIPTATEYTDRAYSQITEVIGKWLIEDGRQAGDITVLPYEITTNTTDGNSTTKVSGYYVVLFQGINDNTMTLPSVRHLFVAFEGGKTDSTTGKKVYTDAEIAAAKTKAEELLKEWQDGAATEETFIELANKESDDGNGTTGGLYEEIMPGQMVEPFEDWCFAEHEYGDVELVQTEYGFHIMFFVSAGDTTYRDYLIEYDLRTEDMNAWFETLVASISSEVGDTSKMDLDKIIAAS